MKFPSSKFIGFTLSVCLALFNTVFNTVFAAGTTDRANKINSEPTVISSLQWGEVLFYTFSDQKMEALIRLYARESRHQLDPHQNEANLLAAGLLLDLGLASEAHLRLDRIEQSELDSTLKSRLALMLARSYYKNQNFPLSKQWLETANEQHLQPSELLNKKMIHAQLLFNEQRFSEAADQLKNINTKSNLGYYANYNLGLSLLNSSDINARLTGQQILTKLSTIEPVDQEQYALVDQAKLALGLHAVNNGNPLQARKQFLAIRLEGLVSTDALLLLGWTLAQTDDFAKALTYWKNLALSAEIFDPAVQESWLAIPYSYQQLGDLKRAAEGYETAALFQEQALQELALMKSEQRWKELLDAQVDRGFSHYLNRKLMANPQFYSLLKEWQELDNFQLKLNESLSVLPILDIVLNESKRRHQQKSDVVKQKLSPVAIEQYQQTLVEMKLDLELQKEKNIAEKILSKNHYQYWLKLNAIQSLIEDNSTEIDLEKIEKFRRIDGVAQWQFHREKDKNIWAVTSGLAELESLINKIVNRDRSLNQLSSKPGQSTINSLQRIQQLKKRSHELTQKVTRFKVLLEDAMAEQFTEFVKKRQLALENLAEQASVALARLRFSALIGNRDDK